MPINDHTLILVQLLTLLFFIRYNRCNFYTTAIPQRANEPWSVILCKFADTAKYEPRTREWYQKWMTGSGAGTIAKYFMDVSNGIYTITDTEVLGWMTLPWTVQQVRLMALMDKTLWKDNSFNTLFFIKAKQLCVEFAARKTKLNKRKITILNAEHGAMYGKEDGVLITPRLSFSSVLAHEMVHSFHIGHSYSDRKINIFPNSHTGEYDDHYDLMSTANAWMHKSRYGFSGPGLNGPHLDYLGWLPSNRILYFGRDGRSSSMIRLSSLSIPHAWTNDWLLVMVPFDRNNPANVFTLEFRTPVNYDSGIMQEAIIIHKVDRKGTNYYSTIVTHSKDYDELMVGTEWMHFLEQDSPEVHPAIKLRVERIDRQRQIAILLINSTFNPMSCRSTKTQRHLTKDTNETTQYSLSNGTHSTKILRCEEKRFFKDLLTFGMNACHDGYVWRMIDPYDYVCVTKERKQQIQNLRKARNRLDICRKPLVPRKAFPSDNVCVTQKEFATTQQENAESHKTMKYHLFFNGEETIAL
uniref:Metalloendopeptidase n=1 Tax=Onchocerca volvulus TaxID=6282 RepID=A0A8R1XL98_ONCVO